MNDYLRLCTVSKAALDTLLRDLDYVKQDNGMIKYEVIMAKRAIDRVVQSLENLSSGH